MWYGIDGNAGVKSNMKELNIWDQVAIKKNQIINRICLHAS